MPERDSSTPSPSAKASCSKHPSGVKVTARDFVDFSWSYDAQAADESTTTVRHRARSRPWTRDTGLRRWPDPDRGQGSRQGARCRSHFQYPFADFPATVVQPIAHMFPVDYARRSAATPSSTSRSAPARTWSRLESQPVGHAGPGPRLLEQDGGSPNSAGPGYVDDHQHADLRGHRRRWLAYQKGSIDSPPCRRATSAARTTQRQGRHLDRQGLPSTAIYFISVSMDKPTLRRAANCRSALPSTWPQTARPSPTSSTRASRSRPKNHAITIPGYVPNLNPCPYAPDQAQASSTSHRHPAPEHPVLVDSGAGHDKIAQALIAGWQKACRAHLQAEQHRDNSCWTQAGRQGPRSCASAGWPTTVDATSSTCSAADSAESGSYCFYNNNQVDDLLNQARGASDETTGFNLCGRRRRSSPQTPHIPVYA